MLKAQVAAEQMFAMAIILIPLVFITAYILSVIEDYINVFLVQSTLDSLQNAINEVYLQEPSSFRTLQLTLPGGINYSGSYIGSPDGTAGRVLQLTYKESQAFRILRANATGSWQSGSGSYVYKINKTEGNIVNVTIST